MALQTTITIQIASSYTLQLDLVSKTANLIKNPSVSLDTGTGLGQADVIFSDTRSTAATDSLDNIGGGLLDNLGNVWAPARIKAIIVVAAAANPGNVLLRRPAANGVPFFTAAADEVPIHPGGIFVLVAPSAAGYPCTAGTADLIDIAAGAGTVSYDVYLIGASA
jgi:hypothetical protein